MKRVSAVLTAAAMCVLLLAGVAGAAESASQRIAEIDQQVAALQAEEKQLQHENSTDGVSKMLIMAGKIVETAPQFIVKGGEMSIAAANGLSTPYFIIKDPEDGIIYLGTYSGWNKIEGRTKILIGNQYYSATILGPLPAAAAARNKRIKAIDSELEALDTERQSLQAQLAQEEQQRMDALRSFSTNADTDIIFQIGNPYYVAYGNAAMIEKGNYAACPVIVSDSTLVPIRAVMDAVQGETGWEADTKSVQLVLLTKTIDLQIDNPTAQVNGQSVSMPVAPKLINGKTMIPLRFVSEQFGMGVEWLASDKVIRLKYSMGPERYLTTNADGSQHYYDSVLNIQYDIPAGCKLEVEPSDYRSHYAVVITKPGINGKITVCDGGLYSAVNSEKLPISEKQEYEGMQSLLYFRYDNIQSEAQYLVDFCGNRLMFKAEGSNDTAVGDNSEQAEQAEKESAAYLDQLEPIVKYMLDSLQAVGVG